MAFKPWSMILVIICASLMAETKSYYEPDKIRGLPGQPAVNFKQYSGYVTVDEKRERSYFYYFVEAERDPASKPLVLWLNGGPGCSSLGTGAFIEHGPFRPSGGALVKNDYSWNRVANMLYLESPAGVGFSYSVNESFYEYIDDKMTAVDNFNFLKQWLEKLPVFKKSTFFITGESYAGHYVPQLADLIVQSKPNLINLKGIALGNPLLEFNTDFNSVSDYLWSHGLISDSTFDQLNSVCNYSRIMREAYQITDDINKNCSALYKQVQTETSTSVDVYDVTLDICLPPASTKSKFLNQLQNQPTIDVCVEGEMEAYLNRTDVQKALHARLVGVQNWTMCSNVIYYEVLDLETSVISLLGKLVKSGIRALVYSGDQDSVIPLTGTRKLVNGLADDIKLNTTRPYGVWLAGKQVGGWAQVYGDLLSFATVRGASHKAPHTQPERSFILFSSFLEGKAIPA